MWRNVFFFQDEKPNRNVGVKRDIFYTERRVQKQSEIFSTEVVLL